VQRQESHVPHYRATKSIFYPITRTSFWVRMPTIWQQITVLTGHTLWVYRIAISPNGRILASVSADQTARLWNLENGQSIGSPLQHEAQVTSVSFSADGMLLATGCDNNNAYTWDMSVVVKKLVSATFF
jgi:WD40 repeat protein